ncbi:MAG TPA: alpha/beta hydrolase [Acidimicrobiales bacterium]|nr:alpha/beta hydrolase [Acidimicrobiales bacterium]
MGAESRERRGAAAGDRASRSGRDWLTWKQTTVAGRPALYGEAGDGPPVLFLHGWGLDHKAYKRALSRLVRGGVHVLAPALPGFGGTAALPGETNSLAGYADWVAEFLRTVGVGRPVNVMGHSFGGGVAIMVAHDHPELTHSLVLINSIGGSAWAHSGSTLRSMAERPLWDWGIHFPADLFPVRQARRVLPVIVGEALPNLLRDPRAFWRAAGLVRRADLAGELDTLRRRRLPVVVLWGPRDHLITRDSFEDLCRALGKPDVVTLTGTHSWLLADPDAFGEIMTNVLEVLGLTIGEPAVAVTSRAVARRDSGVSSACRCPGPGRSGSTSPGTRPPVI